MRKILYFTAIAGLMAGSSAAFAQPAAVQSTQSPRTDYFVSSNGAKVGSAGGLSQGVGIVATPQGPDSNTIYETGNSRGPLGTENGPESQANDRGDNSTR